MITANRTAGQSLSRRPWLALALFLLAPLVGEFLLGNLPITWLGALVTLAPLYGGGAVLIREIARRTGRRWPTMILLGLTYALIEEAFVTQSLFNPEYVGLRLLDFGYMPSLGIGAWWTVFVLGIHTIWSTAVPIALIESWAGAAPAARQPWLGRTGLVVVSLVFVLGCVVTATVHPPNAIRVSVAQFVTSGVLVVALAVLAIRLPRVIEAAARAPGAAGPRVWWVGLTTLAIGSAFMTLALVHDGLPAAVSVGAMLAVLAAGSGFLVWAARRPGWGQAHVAGAAGGFVLTYAWYGFVQIPSVGAPSAQVNLIGDLVFATCAIILMIAIAQRQRRGTRGISTHGAHE